nr:MAG TPA: hypothetical protein [Caudoviricetes sp.]
MIKFEKADVWGFEHAIRGMRNPMNSWERSDSYPAVDCGKCGIVEREGFCNPKEHDCSQFETYEIGQNDYDLMARLIKGGSEHRKFLRQIFVSVDITAPLYWWKEFDTYKVGTTANSQSTMHKIHSKPIELSDFSIDDFEINNEGIYLEDCFINVIADCEMLRQRYMKTKDKRYWRGLVQLLPDSYNQKRTLTMSYENLLNMLKQRKAHKLDEWREFCDWIFTLPNSHILREGVRE